MAGVATDRLTGVLGANDAIMLIWSKSNDQ